MNESSTNVLYDLVEYMERERKRLIIATAIVLLLVPLALTFNLMGFFLMTRRILLTNSEIPRVLSHMGRPIMPSYFLVSLNTITSLALVFLGIKNLLFLNSWGKKLNKIKKIEKKIYEEVMQDKDMLEDET